MEFDHKPGDTYLVIGKDRYGKKFRKVYDNPHFALGINMWDGRVYRVRNGKRLLIKRQTA